MLVRIRVIHFLSTSTTPPSPSTQHTYLSNTDIVIGGLGFIGAGTDVSILEEEFKKAQKLLGECGMERKGRDGTMPIGVGIINWGADMDVAIPLVAKLFSHFPHFPIPPLHSMHPCSFKIMTKFAEILTLTSLQIQARSRMVLRTVLYAVAGRMDGKDERSESGDEDLGPSRKCEGST
jgi:hypothetical protein